MTVSELCLLLLAVNLKVCQCTKWTAKVPSSVKGVVGSCVVIPCSFNYATPPKEDSQMTGIWFDANSQPIYHPIKTKTMPEYQNRTNLLGDLQHKNCSLKIDPLWRNDKGPFYFRIEIANHDNYSYLQNKVSITTTDELVHFSVKEEVLRGETVTANCSVSHSCPDSPPKFSWSHPGQQQIQHQDLGEGLWRTTSMLTFRYNHSETTLPLQCTVTYSGGEQRSAKRTLVLQYAPEIRNVSFCHFEDSQLKCLCITESNPPSEVHLLLSDNDLQDTKIQKYGPLTVATLHTQMGYTKFITCTANNTMGKVEQMLFLPNSSGYMYMGIGIAAAGLILIIVLIVVVARTCSRRRRSACDAPTSHEQSKDVTPQYAEAARKNKTRKDDGHSSFENTYRNMEAVVKADDDDAVYGNV